MEHSYAMISRCDALLRWPAVNSTLSYIQFVSKGSDLEEKFCNENKIPVFYSKEALYGWVNTTQE